MQRHTRWSERGHSFTLQDSDSIHRHAIIRRGGVSRRKRCAVSGACEECHQNNMWDPTQNDVPCARRRRMTAADTLGPPYLFKRQGVDVLTVTLNLSVLDVPHVRVRQIGTFSRYTMNAREPAQ